MTDTISVNIPFSGFYDSTWSGELDHVEEREIEWRVERQTEDDIPEHLHLNEEEFGDLFRRHAEYSAMYEATAREYCAAFDHVASEELAIKLRLQFEEMTSPREYNFQTDRIFALMPMEVLQELFDRSAAEGHKRLEAHIKQRFTSRSGFISGYTNRLSEWLDKPLDEWDHNETGTLLRAALGEDFTSDHSEDLYYATFGDDGAYNTFSNGIDWPKFDADVQELRDEKQAAFLEENPEYEPPCRCPDTPDLFTS